MLFSSLAMLLAAAVLSVAALDTHVLTIQSPYSTMPEPWRAGEKATISWAGATEEVATITAIEIKTNSKWFWQKMEQAREALHASLPLPSSAEDKKIDIVVPKELSGNRYFIKITGITKNGDLFHDYSSRFTILPAAIVVEGKDSTVIVDDTSANTPIEVELDTKKPVIIDTNKPIVIDTSKPIAVDTERPVVVETDKPVDVEANRPVVVETDKAVDVESNQPVELETEKPVEVVKEAETKTTTAKAATKDAVVETKAVTPEAKKPIVATEVKKPTVAAKKTTKTETAKPTPLATPRRVNGTTYKRNVNFALQKDGEEDYDGGAMSALNVRVAAVLALFAVLLI